MQTYHEFTVLDADKRSARANYFTMTSAIVPRPIAWVSTISAAGVTNLAPFSYFTGVCSKPAAVTFSPVNDRNGKPKDTVANLREVGEFVVNTVPYSVCRPMNQSAYPYPPGVSEFDEAGLTPIASKFVRPPRVAESPVHLECELLQIVEVGSGPYAANLCIGKVLCFQVAQGFLTGEEEIDLDKLDPVGRLHGDAYVRLGERFVLPREG